MLEMAQLGYIVFAQATTSIVQVVIAKETARTSFSGVTATTASLVLTDVTNFDGILSSADTTSQSAFETIDDWGKAATDHGVLIGQGVNTPIVAQVLGSGELLIGSVGVDPVAASLTAGANITITPGAGSITIASTASGGMAWSEATGTTQAMASDTGYTVNNGAQIDFTLPATASVGDIFAIAGNSANGWTLTQNASQTVHFLSVDTTTGVGGSITSTTRYDCIEMVCVTANTDFVVRSVMGNLTIV